MPGLQALAGVPSFGGQLGQQLGGGLSQGIGAGINQFLQQKQQKQSGTALAEYLGQPEMASALSQLPKEIHVELAKAYGRQKQHTEADSSVAQQALNRMAELIPETGASILPAWASPTSKGAGNRAEFESQKASLISLLRDKVNKGVLTNQKFEFIKNELLPSHGDRKEIKRRKLKAIGEQLGLDVSALQEGASEGNLKKVAPGTQLSKEEAQNIFKKAGNNPEKARKIAQQLGYEW